MKPTKKRLSRKSRPASRQSKAMVTRSVRTLLPDRLRTNLVWSDYYVFDSGAFNFVALSIRANSCRDPFASVGGGSPSGFAQLASFYNRYRVVNTRAEFWGYNTCAAPLIMGLYWRSSSGAVFADGTEVQQMLLENTRQGAYATLTPKTNTDFPSFRLVSGRTPDQVEGRSTSGEDYAATFAAEPALQTYLDLYCTAWSGGSAVLLCNTMVRVTYTVECFERTQLYTD